MDFCKMAQQTGTNAINQSQKGPILQGEQTKIFFDHINYLFSQNMLYPDMLKVKRSKSRMV